MLRSKPTLPNRKQDMSELYPFPKMPAYTGNVAAAIKLLKAVELDEGPVDRYEEGYVAGMEMARRLLRLQLGLAVPGDGA